MLSHCPDTLRGLRDAALLSLGFAGAFRRSELVALTVADLVEAPDGYRVTIRGSRMLPLRSGWAVSPDALIARLATGVGREITR